MIFNFLARKSINLDICNRCTLACSKCWRDYYLSKGNKVPGRDMTIDEFKKIIQFFEHISFCGEVSDPILHPKFTEFLKLAYLNGNSVDVRTAVSHKPTSWYLKYAFPANPKAQWVFGIDGLPKDSHKYRVRQDGEKLFEIMKLGANLGISVTWACIIMSYNENDIDKIIDIAKRNNIKVEFSKSSRWFKNDPFKPKNPENVVDGNWRPFDEI